MIDTTKIFEVGNQRGLVATSSEGQKIGTLTLRSNAAYESVLGFSFGIHNTTKMMVNGEAVYVENNVPYAGGARVSITDGNGKVILPMVPYGLLKWSDQQQFVNRFVEIANVRGYDSDINVRFEFQPTPNVDGEPVRYIVTAQAIYSQRTKTL